MWILAISSSPHVKFCDLEDIYSCKHLEDFFQNGMY